MLRIECDALCEPRNPGGYACWAFRALRDGNEIFHTAECMGAGMVEVSGQSYTTTNNLAEYTAVLKALRWVYTFQITTRAVQVVTDSQLVVKQVSGEFACNKPHLEFLRDRVRLGLDKTGAALSWIPGKENQAADAYSFEALLEAVRKNSDSAALAQIKRKGFDPAHAGREKLWEAIGK